MVIARVIPQRLQLQAQVTSASLSDVTIPESAQSRTRVDRCLSALKRDGSTSIGLLTWYLQSRD